MGRLRPRAIPARTRRSTLAAKMLQSKSALEGERKQVTVLFVDVKGSMELAEPLDPEVFHRVMERFATLLAAGVHRFEGTVIGDETARERELSEAHRLFAEMGATARAERIAQELTATAGATSWIPSTSRS
jgi:class 3 adenylate cyclase